LASSAAFSSATVIFSWNEPDRVRLERRSEDERDWANAGGVGCDCESEHATTVAACDFTDKRSTFPTPEGTTATPPSPFETPETTLPLSLRLALLPPRLLPTTDVSDVGEQRFFALAIHPPRCDESDGLLSSSSWAPSCGLLWCWRDRSHDLSFETVASRSNLLLPLLGRDQLRQPGVEALS
jgi:hypothetical protein